MKESGNKYSLQELLTSEDNEKIVIPDLQRDYCWGTTGTLVDDFIASLIGNFKNHPSEELLMGLIYGYYEEERPYLQLCDGQQRLTALVAAMYGVVVKDKNGNIETKMVDQFSDVDGLINASLIAYQNDFGD